jgi:hypothetical protein
LHKTSPPSSNQSLRQALERNKYELGWSGKAVGVPDDELFCVPLGKPVFESDDSAKISYNRADGPGEIHVTLGNRKLTGYWKDADGRGELELEFGENFARAEGWWNKGGQTKKYNAFMRQIK